MCMAPLFTGCSGDGKYLPLCCFVGTERFDGETKPALKSHLFAFRTSGSNARPKKRTVHPEKRRRSQMVCHGCCFAGSGERIDDRKTRAQTRLPEKKTCAGSSRTRRRRKIGISAPGIGSTEYSVAPGPGQNADQRIESTRYPSPLIVPWIIWYPVSS